LNKKKESALTVEQFLNKLPTKVVRSSQLVDVRGDVAALLLGAEEKSSEPSGTATQVIAIDSDSVVSASLDTNDATEAKMAMLKVKWLNNNSGNNRTYLFKMRYTDTLLDLKNLVKAQRLLRRIHENLKRKKMLKLKFYLKKKKKEIRRMAGG
jgi:hypothetical protein